MIITRKLGKIFRGKATAPQLMMAAVIGTMAGFLPPPLQAPGLYLVLFSAALILNANLGLTALCILAGKLLSILLLPLSFWLGHLLLEGPLQSLFAFMVNAPVLAFFGFEYYATTGGMLLGFLLGIGFGVAAIKAVSAFRRKMAELDTGSEKWKKFTGNRAIRILLFIFIGGKQNLNYADLAQRKRFGNPIRPEGILAVVLAGVCMFFVALLLSDEIVSHAVRTGLEEANGATVDLEGAQLRLREGSLTLTGLAVADREALHTDVFRAEKIEARLDTADLLRKRLHIETIRVAAASSGELRERPGLPIKGAPRLPPPPRQPNERTMEDYLREAEKWKHRLAQVADWLDRLSGSERAERESDRRRDPTAVLSYRTAMAHHLIEGAPTLLISSAAVEKMRVKQFPDETLAIVGENLSTHPQLVANPPRISVRSSAESLTFDARLAAFSRNPGQNTMEFAYLNVPVERIASGLRFAEKAPIQGGRLDVRANGTWSLANINLPLEVTLRESRLSLGRAGETSVDRLVLPIGVDGPLRNPRIHFTDAALADALTKAGRAEVARRVTGEAEKLRTQAEERIGGEVLERSRGLLDPRLITLPGSRENR